MFECCSLVRETLAWGRADDLLYRARKHFEQKTGQRRTKKMVYTVMEEEGMFFFTVRSGKKQLALFAMSPIGQAVSRRPLSTPFHFAVRSIYLRSRGLPNVEAAFRHRAIVMATRGQQCTIDHAVVCETLSSCSTQVVGAHSIRTRYDTHVTKENGTNTCIRRVATDMALIVPQ